MKKYIPIVLCWYGFASSIVALIWMGMSQLLAFQMGTWLVEGLFLVHGCVLVVTLHRDPTRILWPPVLRVTPKRIRTAKILLAMAFMNTVAWLSLMLLRNGKGDGRSVSSTLAAFLASLCLLSTIYVALHWAFRPENLFSRRFLVFISNPLGVIVRKHL